MFEKALGLSLVSEAFSPNLKTLFFMMKMGGKSNRKFTFSKIMEIITKMTLFGSANSRSQKLINHDVYEYFWTQFTTSVKM